jgi:hypothetical protein
MSSPSDRTATRRDFLKATAAGAAGLALGGTASGGSRTPLGGTAKACIFINLVGGPSHLDTFDPKPLARSDVRGPFRPIPTRVPGVHLSELFPKLATLTDKFSLIRSLHHDAPPIHEAGFQLLNTGRLFRDGPEWPSAGCVWTYLNGDHDTGAGRRHYVAPGVEIETGVNVGKGLGPGFLAARVRPQSAGANLPNGPGLPDCHLVRTQHDPRYGPTTFGFNLRGAMASAERRPGRFLTVNMFSTVFDAPSWDCHADRGSLATDLDDYRDTVAPAFDTAFSALLTDLDARGLLDSTLVVATGEFGRTPFLNANGGRDHWANCWTALVAGGGVKGGRVVGASDDLGGEPKDRPVTPQELVATIFHALGVPPDATIPGPSGSPVAVYPGTPVTELF